MTELGKQLYMEFIDSYLQRESSQEFLRIRDKERRVRFEGVPVVGSAAIFLGAMWDYWKVITEAEMHATFKGYEFD